MMAQLANGGYKIKPRIIDDSISSNETLDLNLYKFTIFTFIATFPTLFTYVYIGNNLGENYSEIRNYVGGYGIPILIFLLLCMLFYFLFKFYKMKQSKRL